ncbi:hypothetical protein [Blastopirellula retiformator]|uniref:DUF669 domain-containing protein n=1 Tax=Blastopirellula retiformator TaxID=2527970 RepID=A0A5C5UYW9_9BACT|nr:hypothetical protein [Blastopirellula retiformator]TWT30682.1 hypothetical protein Enr8_42050 [Blastopirellula retiformator]
MVSFTAPQNMEVSSFLEHAGRYHFLVTAVDENPVSKDGSQISAIKLECKVLAGDDPTQNGKQWTCYLNLPNMSHKDGGEFASKVLCRAAKALCVLPQVAPGQPVNIDFNLAVGRTFLATIEKRDDRTSLKGGDIFAPNDPEAKEYPRNQQVLSQQASAQSQAAPVQAAQPAASAPQQTQPTQVAQQPVGAGATADPFSTL